MDVNNPQKMVLIGIDPYPYFYEATLNQNLIQCGAPSYLCWLSPTTDCHGYV